MRQPPLSWVNIVFLFALVPACSQSGPQAVPIRSVNDYVARAHSGDLSAGAEPFDTYAKSNKAFGASVSREFTPVQLVVESTTVDKLLLQRSKAKLVCEDGTSLEAVPAHVMFEPFREHIIGSVAIGFPSGAAMSADKNERTKSDWIQKEFPAEKILTTGERTGGFLYFRGTCPSRRGRQLQLTADKMSSAETVTLSFELR
jgi:hypothetical protein